MKIFRIRHDVSKYQTFIAADPNIWNTNQLSFEGLPKKDSWSSPEVYYPNPLEKLGDFVYLCPGVLVFNARARECCANFFEMSGEILPIYHEQKPLFALNVTQCWNVLDQERTQWKYDKYGTIKLRIEKYYFHPHRIPEVPLFKIPETVKTSIYTCQGMKDPENEFKYNVEINELTGLIFEQVWSEED